MNAPSYEEDVNDRDPEIMLAKAEIARTREAVAASVLALQREISHTFAWWAWVGRRPFQAVLLAFGVGAALGYVRVKAQWGRK